MGIYVVNYGKIKMGAFERKTQMFFQASPRKSEDKKGTKTAKKYATAKRYRGSKKWKRLVSLILVQIRRVL